MPITRPILNLAGAALVFVSGWTLHRPPPARAVPASTGSEPTACSDPLAMAANATLVGEVRDARNDLALARERSKATIPAAEILPGGLQASADDWARRATDDRLTLHVPCSRWNGSPSFTIHGARKSSHMRRSGDATRRADFLGLEPGERETLAQVYTRTQSRVWQSIRQVCESGDDYRKAIADETDVNDGDRVAACRVVLVDATDVATRRAYRDVVAIRASGHNDRSEQLDRRARVLFVLTGAPEVLYDEMKRTFGRDNAARLIDNGVSCFDENAYDLRGAEPGG